MKRNGIRPWVVTVGALALALTVGAQPTSAGPITQIAGSYDTVTSLPGGMSLVFEMGTVASPSQFSGDPVNNLQLDLASSGSGTLTDPNDGAHFHIFDINGDLLFDILNPANVMTIGNMVEVGVPVTPEPMTQNLLPAFNNGGTLILDIFDVAISNTGKVTLGADPHADFSLTVIPEPTSLLVWGLIGTVGLGWFWLLRRRQAGLIAQR
jgi:hypothetical protein